MLKQLPPLKSLLAFAAASRSKNFSRAADELCITPSAISHQIKKLENQLGHKLFYREGNQLLLTPAGETLAQTVNPAFEQIVSATKILTGQQESALQFGVSSAFAVHRLTPQLSDLNQRYPHLDIRLRMLTCEDNIDNLDLDILLLDRPYQHIAYEYVALKTECYFPVASPTVADKLKALCPTQWQKHTQLIDIQGVNSWQTWFGQNYNNHTADNYQLFGHTLLMLQAVIAKQGIALIGESLIVNELANSSLVKLTANPFNFADDGFYFCWHKRRQQDRNITTIKHWLIELLS